MVATETPVPARDLRPLITAIVAITICGAGLSLSIPLIALRMEEAGFSGQANGLGTATSGLATLLFVPMVPAIAARLGMRGMMLACIVVLIASLAALAATGNMLLWFPIRGLYSCGLTGLFVASEFAVNALAPSGRRGLWIGVYSTCLALGFATGPAILGLAGTQGVAPFVAGMALFAVAAVPVAALGNSLPVLDRRESTPVFALLRTAPGLMACAFVFGAIETGGMGLLPVHALRNGLSPETGALYVAALAIGNAILQIPIGLLSDRIDRRLMLRVLAATTLAGALALVVLTGTLAFVPVLIIWGGLGSGLYMVGLAELGARYVGAELAAANAGFVFAYASGMMLGPPAFGRALDMSPRYGLFGSLALLSAALLAVLIARARKH